MLQRIYNEYNFNIEPVLIKEYKRLGLTTEELNVLLVLIAMHKKRNTFSVNAISRRIDYTQNKIAVITESLLDKNFITITLESRNKREREIFEISGIFEKITSLFIEDEKDKLKKLNENNVSDVVLQMEQSMGRMLRTTELEKIRSWFEDRRYNYESIVNAITLADKRTSVAYVERILSQEIPANIVIDDKTDKALEELFKKL